MSDAYQAVLFDLDGTLLVLCGDIAASEKPKEWQADHYIDTPQELLPFLASLLAH